MTSVGKGVETLELLYFASGDVSDVAAVETAWQHLSKLNLGQRPHDPAIPLERMCPRV